MVADRWTAETEEALAQWMYRAFTGRVDWIDDQYKNTWITNARICLIKLADLGLLLPPGGETRTEYGVDRGDDGDVTMTGMRAVGTDIPAQRFSTHQRQHTVWPDKGTNDHWASYTTAWEEKEKA